MGGLAYSNGKSAKLATPTPSPVARQITSGATPTATPNVYSFALHPELHQPSGTTNLSRLDTNPTPTSNTNTECEELRKSEQQLTARVKQLGKLVDYFAIDWKLGDAERAKEVAKKNEERARANAARKGCPYKYGIEFMKIPAGRFMMGGAGDDEKPVHEVTIRSFCIGEYEVTQAQWQAVMESNPSSFKDCGGDCPVENVSWNDAQNFINKLNESNDGFRYRLPTEAEWEYAGRAGTTGDYAGNLNEIAWYSENSGNRTHAVGGKQPNAWGLYDMIGNVQEWCEDWDHKNYDGAPTDGSAWVAPTVRQDRVQRGGSFAHTAGRLRSANRDRNTPADRHRLHGLRVVAYR
jgi:formylglycine-generating enzyme required for sulfatase activity